MTLTLRNPHSIHAVLDTRPDDVEELALPTRDAGDVWEEIADLARTHRIRITESVAGPENMRGKRRRMRSHQEHEGRAGSGWAVVAPRRGLDIDSFIHESGIEEKAQGLWLALDCLQDPQNVGSIFRTAAFFGVKGIIMTRDRSAPLTAAAYDVGSGGMEYVPFTVQVNLRSALDAVKDAGLWLLGTSEHAEEPLDSIGTDRPWCCVLGNEESGIRRLTRECCDNLVAIPSAGGRIGSLNVSVAAGIVVRHLT